MERHADYQHIRVYEYGDVRIVSTKEENRLIGVLSKIGLVRYGEEELSEQERSEIDKEFNCEIINKKRRF